MRPIVEVSPVAIWVTVLGGLALVVCFFLAWKWGKKHRYSFLVVTFATNWQWAIIVAGSVFAVGLGSWMKDATRKPTKVEAQAWIKEAEQKLKENQRNLKAAIENARRVREKVQQEEEAERQKREHSRSTSGRMDALAPYLYRPLPPVYVVTGTFEPATKKSQKEVSK